jgi:hypothetical protein
MAKRPAKKPAQKKGEKSAKKKGKQRGGLMGFKSFKERGEWVEMLFMADASFRKYRVLKPSGECFSYDVAIEIPGGMLRVQVKSTTFRYGAGYLCEFTHGSKRNNRRYQSGELDLCVAYVIPKKLWYIIPARKVTGRQGKAGITLGQRKDCRNKPKYEQYREAWHLLEKDRTQLLSL